MMHPSRQTIPTTSPADRTPNPTRRRWGAVLMALGLTAALAACGSDSDGDDAGDDTEQDESVDDAAETASDTNTDTNTDNGGGDEATDDASGDDGGEAASPDDVAACLEDAGYVMVTGSETLSEQQLADLNTLFGQVESLTFDTSSVEFAGGIAFFETPEQAQERAQTLGDVALAQRVVGNSLVNVEAGSNFDDAVANAETCLS